MPKANNCSFGAQAFLDWANDIEQGRYDDVSSENFNKWRDYTIYVCNYSTNCSCRNFLKRALKYNPDMTLIDDIHKAYDEMSKLCKELENIGGGFGITLET